MAILSPFRRRAARCLAVFCTFASCSSTVPLSPCLRMALPPRLTRAFKTIDLVRLLTVEDTSHAADAPVSSRYLLELERGHVDREFLELSLVGEELVRLLQP